MVQKPPRYPYPSKTYLPVGRCVYCLSTENLSKEHIIPLAFGGELILPKASCEKHREATSKIENFILRKYLCALRSHLGLPSRKPGERPDGYPLKLSRKGRTWKKKVSLADHPGYFRFIMFATPPGRVTGQPPVQETFSIRLIDVHVFPDIAQRLARLGADSFEDHVTINALALARFVAKIGHAFAMAELGPDLFEECYITHLIDGNAPDWNYWIGSYDRGEDIAASELHELRFVRRGDDLSVVVHLLVPYCPRYAYEVIVGRLRSDAVLPPPLTLSATPSATQIPR
jgi:hypothetical protein